ncbi:MAG: cupin-like domain-containing protein [Acidobacteriota bacterium]
MIDVRKNLSPREFEKEYLEKLRPVILDDSIGDWEARTWTPEWFREHFPDKIVQIDGRGVRLDEFIGQLLASDEEHPAPYLRNCDLPTQFPELLSYVSRAPHSLPSRLGSRLLPKNFPQENHYLDIFIGGPGSGFPTIHYDVHHLVAYLVQIYGRKEFTVYPPDQGRYLYPRASQPDESEIVNPLHPDYDKYPLWKEAKGITFVLEPGQTLFVPCGWWHYTRMLTPSITIGYDQLCAANWGEFIGDQYARRRHRAMKARVFLAYLIATGTVLTTLERLRGLTHTAVDLNFPRQFRKALDFRL